MAVTKHIKAVIQLRRATEAQWINLNPVLVVGEPAYSTDVHKTKVGDGTSTWTELPYLEDSIFDEAVLIDCGTSR